MTDRLPLHGSNRVFSPRRFSVRPHRRAGIDPDVEGPVIGHAWLGMDLRGNDEPTLRSDPLVELGFELPDLLFVFGA
jgi:hypothetical protein